MSLECEFSDDYEPGAIYWCIPNAFVTYSRKRATKCCSCGAKVKAEDKVLRFERYTAPGHDIEIRIYGECGAVPRAPWFMCEPCGNIYLFLNEFKYAIFIDKDMRKLAKEHAALVAANADGCGGPPVPAVAA